MPEIINPFSTTGIGSLPHKNSVEACNLIFKTFDIPFWPQLPMLNFKESMLIQYSEGMPFLKIDTNTKTAWIIRDGSDELERFYESYTENTKISISEDFAKGLHTFLKLIRGRRFKILKGHVTGPLTFTLGIKDNFGRYIYFDEELREISLMLLKAKVRWQIDLLKQYSDYAIIFIDEPVLSSIGSSSYLGVSNEEVLRLLKELINTIDNAGAISGIHCCGRADWQQIMKSGVKIVSFDAFEYFKTFIIYHEEIKDFLKKGGYLALGIVPTSDAISFVDEQYIFNLMSEELKEFTRYGLTEFIRSRIILTPSCGTGSRSIEETTKIFQLLIRLKEELTDLKL
jgi:methionine synthase II (cobalamin-independent)